MRIKLILLFIVLMLLSCSSTPQASIADKNRSSQVDELFAKYNRPDSPGAAVLVVKDGEIMHSKGYGSANITTRQPIKPETKFDLASVSKQFTAMAIMILAERGQLSYDDPLTKFFPQFPKYAQRITVRHLLYHTAGLPDYIGLFYQDGEGEPSARDMLNLLIQQSGPEFRAGTQYEYSNSGYLVLAMIVEQVSKKTYPQFLKEYIFQPLEMSQTIVNNEQKPAISNKAISYDREGKKIVDVDYDPLNYIYGDGGVHSTILDLYKWDQALYTERLVSASTLQQAFKSGQLADGSDIDYGFGWEIGKYRRQRFVKHDGSWAGFRTMIVRYPVIKFSVIVLANYGQVDVDDLANKITDIYFSE